MSPQAISRVLRTGGFYTTSNYNRQGMRARRSPLPGEVSVIAQFDLDAQAVRVAAEAAQYLREHGYTVRVNPKHPQLLTVTKEVK